MSRRAPAELKLGKNLLSYALRYLEANHYALYFPDPFELKAIRHSWAKIRPVLANINLLSYNARVPLKMIAPKNKWSVRPIRLLDPIDTILLTACVLNLAQYTNFKRAQLAHAHRYDKTKKNFVSDWPAHVKKIRELSGKYSYAATADIVDFFPRIYQHRLENGLSSMTYDKNPFVIAIMRMLGTFSEAASYGIPIGPLAACYLSEIALHEVDEYLISEGLIYSRFSDDYIFFGHSEADCIKALYSLGERLHETQGLSLNMAKTDVLSSEKIVAKYSDPSDPDSSLQAKIIDEVFDGNPYKVVDPDKLTDDEKKLIKKVDCEKMLEIALEHDLTDYKAVQFVLNFMSSLGRPELSELLLKNLDKLQPISHTVSRFFDVFDKLGPVAAAKIGSSILKYIKTSPYATDYQSMWLLQPFVNSNNWNNVSELRSIARDAKNRLVRRQAILAIGNSGDRSALLDLKSNIGDTKDWEWRAIIFACRRLPRDEREAYWRSLDLRGDWTIDNLLAKATLEYAKRS